MMKLEERLRNYLISNSDISPAAFIYENETYRMPADLDFVVKEWRIDMSLGRLTEERRTQMVMMEYDVIQRENSQIDFITEPAEKLMLALQDFTDDEVWDVQVETGTAEHRQNSSNSNFKNN